MQPQPPLYGDQHQAAQQQQQPPPPHLTRNLAQPPGMQQPPPGLAPPIQPQQQAPPTQQASADHQRSGGAPSAGNHNEDLIFAAFYRGEMTANQLVQVMSRLAQYPGNTAEADLLARMLRTLFTECRHFPRYPTPELYRTANFYGKLIRSELLLKRPELQLLAIRCVMEALRKEVHTPIFRFGLVALQGFLPIAPCSPVFLQSLTHMQGLREYFPSVVRFAEQCLDLMPPRVKTMSLIDARQLSSSLPPGQQMPSCNGVLIIPPAFQLAPEQQQQENGFIGMFGSAAGGNEFGKVNNPAAASLHSSQQGEGNSGPLQTSSGNENSFEVKLQGFGLGQVERLMEDPEILDVIIVPPEAIRNKVFRVFNSLAPANVNAKVEELLEVLQPDWIPWVGYYLVKSRVSKEVNHHDLYYMFADRLGGARMLDMLANLTYDCINVLLKYVVSARGATSYRTVLKSLGTWLGLLTLAQNKTLRAKSFDVMHLLYDSYERGNLVAVLPLVCACLGQMKNSRIFKPPNPWVISVLATLGNLFTMPGLKQSTLFEIELLMRQLGLDISNFVGVQPNIFETIKPASDSPDFQTPPHEPKAAPATWNKQRPQQQAEQTPYYSSTTAGAPAAPPAIGDPPSTYEPGAPPPEISAVNKQNMAVVASLTQGVQHLIAGKARAGGAGGSPTTGSLGPLRTQLLNNLAGSVAISRSLALFQRNPELRVAVPIAVERGVREIISMVTDRAVVLAVGTTTELVLKDFCMEPEGTLVKRAGHLMAACLGGSIVLVTGRAALKSSICNHLKEVLSTVEPLGANAGGRNAKTDELVEQTAQVVAQDNLEMATIIIEQVVIEHCIRAVQEALTPALNARRLWQQRQHQLLQQHRMRLGEDGGDDTGASKEAFQPEPFRDPNYFGPNHTWPAALPPTLALTSPIDPKLLQVYRNFSLADPLRRMRITHQQQQQQPQPPLLQQQPPVIPAAPQTQSLSEVAVTIPAPAPAQAQPPAPASTPAPSANGAVGVGSAVPTSSPTSAPAAGSSAAEPDPIVREALIAIGEAVTTMKEHVKLLMFQKSTIPLPEVPRGTSPAARLLATLPPDNQVFAQIDRVVSLVQNSPNQGAVALSTARRLLRSIHDAAHRGSTTLHLRNKAVIEGDPSGESIDISNMYLEVFIGLLRKFDELQLVHNLREVVTIWLVSATYLVPQKTPSKELKTIDFSRFMPDAAAHGLIVLDAASKYSLVEPHIIDRVFVGPLSAQALGGLSRALQDAPEDLEGNKDLLRAVALTFEFAAHTIYLMIPCGKDPLNHSKQSLQNLRILVEMLDGNNGSDEDQSAVVPPPSQSPILKALAGDADLQFPCFSLGQKLVDLKRPLKLIEALHYVLSVMQNQPLVHEKDDDSAAQQASGNTQPPPFTLLDLMANAAAASNTSRSDEPTMPSNTTSKQVDDDSAAAVNNVPCGDNIKINNNANNNTTSLS